MTAKEAISELSALMTREPDFAVAIDTAIEALQNIPTEMPGTYREQVRVLASLDGRPPILPCDKLWTPNPEGWCVYHCKDGQQEPDKECWLKYAEVMSE